MKRVLLLFCVTILLIGLLCGCGGAPAGGPRGGRPRRRRGGGGGGGGPGGGGGGGGPDLSPCRSPSNPQAPKRRSR